MSGDVVERSQSFEFKGKTYYRWPIMNGPSGSSTRISDKPFPVVCPCCGQDSNSQAAEIERLTKERDAALDNDWVAAPAYAAKVEQCRQYRDRADHLEQALLGLLHHAMGTKWEHVKTGGKYTILGACRIEATNTPAYLYRSDSDGTVWARPMDEFLDGRFTRTLTNGGENGR